MRACLQAEYYRNRLLVCVSGLDRGSAANTSAVAEVEATLASLLSVSQPVLLSWAPGEPPCSAIAPDAVCSLVTQPGLLRCRTREGHVEPGTAERDVEAGLQQHVRQGQRARSARLQAGPGEEKDTRLFHRNSRPLGSVQCLLLTTICWTTGCSICCCLFWPTCQANTM